MRTVAAASKACSSEAGSVNSPDRTGPGRRALRQAGGLRAVPGHLLAGVPAVPDPSTRAVAVTFATAVPDLPGLTAAERAVLAAWVQRSLAHLCPSS